MPLLQPAQVNYVTDKLSAIYNCYYGSYASGFGLGDGATWGAALKGYQLRTILEGSSASIFSDADLESVWASQAINFESNNLPAAVFPNIWSGFMSNLNAVAAKAKTVNSSISSLDSFMLWYNFSNAATYWQCLACPDWYYTYQALNNGNAPSALNCYYQILYGGSYRGTTFTNGVAKFAITGAGAGTLTQGTPVPSGFAGGYAYVNVQAITGSGLLTVVGVDQSGNAETWTATISATGTVQLTPQNHSYSLLTSVTSITVASGLTAGTIYIEVHPPSGRNSPPS